MIDETTGFEQELRELYAGVAPPPAPASWHARTPTRADSDSSPAGRRRRRLPFARLAAVAAALAAIAAIAVVSLWPATRVGISVSPAGAVLSCRLPISALSNDHTTGFILLDHGSARFQPVRTTGTTYIQALGVWANVLPQMVAPDGRSYVSQRFTGGRTTIALTDARGTRTLLVSTAPVDVFAYATMGILLVDMAPHPGPDGPSPGLRLEVLDAGSGALRPFPFASPQLPRGDSEAGYDRSSNAIWLEGYTGASTTVSRYDLATGRTTEWFSAADGLGVAHVVGADSQGDPIVQVADRDVWHTDPAHRGGSDMRTLLLIRPHDAVILNEGRVGDPGVAGAFSPLSATDGDAVWLASADGAIWLYRPANGLQQVATITTSTQGSPGVAISGPCS